MLQKLFSLEGHTCPWWLTFTFDNPLRRLIHNPNEILGEYIQEGDTVVDIGSGMGYFSLAMAKMVGESGRVIAIDIQQKMLEGLSRRSRARRLSSRITPRHCSSDTLNIHEPVDFALAFWMVHEVPDQERFFREIIQVLKPAGRFLMVEPLIHVPQDKFDRAVKNALCAGFNRPAQLRVNLSRAILFENVYGARSCD